MIRVLHILTALDSGGTEAQVLEVLRRFDAARWRPAAAWLRGRGELAPGFRDAGIETFDLRSDDPLGAVTFRRTLRAMRAFRPHVVHTHHRVADVMGGAAARLSGVPVVISTRHYEDPRIRFPPAALGARLAAALPHRIAVVSGSVGLHVRRRLGLPEGRLALLPYGQPANGGPVGRDPASRSVLRRRLGLPPGTQVVTCITRLTERKGILDLLRAASLLRAPAPEARFLVAGRGEERARLEQAIGDLGLRDRVLLLGFRPDVSALLRGSDLLVLPSRLEGFGLVLLEAMETGLPVVGTRVGAIPEVVADGETGILVPPRDPDSLAAAILRVLRYPDLADAMGRAGRARVRAEFSIDRAVAGHEALYLDMLGKVVNP